MPAEEFGVNFSPMSAFHNYPSKLLERAVREFASLPGIGNKTALRLVLHLLKQDKEEVEGFGNALIELKKMYTIAAFARISRIRKPARFALIPCGMLRLSAWLRTSGM